jgi:hypothetical protein
VKNEIEEKLRRLLKGDQITDEPKVTYFLAECRKLFEHDKSLRIALPTLEFYCNWALHTQLSRAGAQAFLSMVDPILTMNGEFDQAQHDALHALLTLETFRLELRTFLGQIGANQAVCDDQGKWMSFLMLYSHVVENSELTLEKSAPANGAAMLAVKRVTIRPIRSADDLAEGAARVFPMIWIVEYEDGRVGQFDLSDLGLLGATLTLVDPASAAATVTTYEEKAER